MPSQKRDAFSVTGSLSTEYCSYWGTEMAHVTYKYLTMSTNDDEPEAPEPPQACTGLWGGAGRAERGSLEGGEAGWRGGGRFLTQSTPGEGEW